jgi:hypothetical protein
LTHETVAEVAVVRKKLDRKRVAIGVVVLCIAVAVGAVLLTRGDRPLSLSGIAGGLGIGSSSTTVTPGNGSPGGAKTTTSTVVGKDHTKQSVAPSRSADADVPAADGAKLVTITAPPAETLAMVSRDGATAGSEYTVVVRVYGWGPAAGSTRTAVVRVSESAPVGQVSKPFAFKGRNVLVRLDPDDADALARGGSYRGIILLRLTGDVLIPWLGDVVPAS